MISFNVPRATVEKITALLKLAEDRGILNVDDRMSNHMDLSAVIAQGCPLDLDRMIEHIDYRGGFDVAHDLLGIRRHIDRDDRSSTGGKLLDCFSPRFTKRETAAA